MPVVFVVVVIEVANYLTLDTRPSLLLSLTLPLLRSYSTSRGGPLVFLASFVPIITFRWTSRSLQVPIQQEVQPVIRRISFNNRVPTLTLRRQLFHLKLTAASG